MGASSADKRRLAPVPSKLMEMNTSHSVPKKLGLLFGRLVGAHYY